MRQLPQTMTAVLLKGHGGLDQLEYRTDVLVPRPKPSEVVVRVLGSSVNNTDINTRIGWYSKSVRAATNDSLSASNTKAEDASWVGQALRFPRIQGADCFGEIAAVGTDVPELRIGTRVFVKTVMHAPGDPRPFRCWSLGSECDGGFAEYVAVPGVEAFDVETSLSDEELGCIPCAYGTAEGMLARADVGPGDRVLVTGASGGVGFAAVQLAKLRGASVAAVVGNAEKAKILREHGADEIVMRGANPVDVLGSESMTCIVDLVSGPGWGVLLDLLEPGGRYAVAGAIGGPIDELDVRTVYLKDLTLFGCTYQEPKIVENLVRYLREGRLKPRIGKVFPLKEIGNAQEL